MSGRVIQAVKQTSTSASQSVVSYSGSVNATGQTASWWSEAEADLFNRWASSYDNSLGAFGNPYFDYFFTGQDIKVTIDGLMSSDDDLPIYSFGYNVQQQKTPLYGFWSYTYDAMLRGTRIVSGAFSIVSMSPTFLTEKIAKAARVRAKAADDGTLTSRGMYSIAGLEEDESRIDRYWRKHYDPDAQNQQNLFSIHPPFNFIIKYGWQDGSLVSGDPNISAQDIRDRFLSQDAIAQDFNERLIQSMPTGNTDMSILLDNVEITSKSVEYNVDGDPLLETYTFLARDEQMLKPLTSDQLRPVVPDKPATGFSVGLPGYSRIMQPI